MCIRDSSHAAYNRRCTIYKEQLDKLSKPVQPKPRQPPTPPTLLENVSEPVAQKPKPKFGPVPKPPSAVSPSKYEQGKWEVAPFEPEREPMPAHLVPLPQDDDRPLPPPPKPCYPRSGKKGKKPQAKNTDQPKPATGPKPVLQKPERPPTPESAPKASTTSPRSSYAAAAKRSPQATNIFR